RAPEERPLVGGRTAERDCRAPTTRGASMPTRKTSSRSVLTDERLAYIRDDRQGHPKKLARALGISVPHVDRALRDLGDEDTLRRARRQVGRVLRRMLVLRPQSHLSRWTMSTTFSVNTAILSL